MKCWAFRRITLRNVSRRHSETGRNRSILINTTPIVVMSKNKPPSCCFRHTASLMTPSFAISMIRPFVHITYIHFATSSRLTFSKKEGSYMWNANNVWVRLRSLNRSC